MRNLLLRVALWVAISVIGSFASAWLLLSPNHEQFEAEIGHQFEGLGLRAIASDLEATPVADRPAELAKWQARLAYPVQIVDNPRPDAASAFAHMDRVEGGTIWVPMGDEALMVGPMPAFRLDPPTWPFVTALIGIVLTTALLVTWPISRRLAELERASLALESGHLDTRIEPRGNDVLGRVAQAFNTMATALQRRVRDREELLQAVAHELNTPLARLSFQIELLSQKATEPAVQARVGEIRREVSELDQLTAELTAWVRLEGDPADRVPIDLAEVARSAAGRVGGNIRVDASRATILADEGQIRRAIENVLRNAVRYAKTGVTITVDRHGERAYVTIDDDGPGVPIGDRERIFEPFTRLDAARSRDEGGLGLGLAIVRRVLDRSGGSVEIGGSPTGGARFALSWPTA